MPRYTSSQTFTEGNTQIVALPEEKSVEEKKSVAPEDEDLEIKLARITEQVPVRIQNTSGSSAGSGSGDFHQVIVLVQGSWSGVLHQRRRAHYFRQYGPQRLSKVIPP